jgi:hypothetical protein
MQIITAFNGRGPHHSYIMGWVQRRAARAGGGNAVRRELRRSGARNPGFHSLRRRWRRRGTTQAFAGAATASTANGEPRLATAFPAADLAFVRDCVLARCDALDGLVDGIVSVNTCGCREPCHSL